MNIQNHGLNPEHNINYINPESNKIAHKESTITEIFHSNIISNPESLSSSHSNNSFIQIKMEDDTNNNRNVNYIERPPVKINKRKEHHPESISRIPSNNNINSNVNEDVYSDANKIQKINSQSSPKIKESESNDSNNNVNRLESQVDNSKIDSQTSITMQAYKTAIFILNQVKNLKKMAGMELPLPRNSYFNHTYGDWKLNVNKATDEGYIRCLGFENSTDGFIHEILFGGLPNGRVEIQIEYSYFEDSIDEEENGDTDIIANEIIYMRQLGIDLKDDHDVEDIMDYDSNGNHLLYFPLTTEETQKLFKVLEKFCEFPVDYIDLLRALVAAGDWREVTPN